MWILHSSPSLWAQGGCSSLATCSPALTPCLLLHDSARLLLSLLFAAFFPLLLLFQSIILPLRQDRESLTALASAYV